MIDQRLLKNLRRFQTQAEATAYLDWAGDLLLALGLQNDDLRFHFNPTGHTRYVLPLTINNRYIFSKGRDSGEQATWWLIHPGPHAQLEAEVGEGQQFWSFAHRRHDPPKGPPRLVQYRVDFVRAHWDELFALVLSVARRELEACRGSTPCRLAHSSQAYALALDDATRAEAWAGVAFGVRPSRKTRRMAVS